MSAPLRSRFVEHRGRSEESLRCPSADSTRQRRGLREPRDRSRSTGRAAPHLTPHGPRVRGGEGAVKKDNLEERVENNGPRTTDRERRTENDGPRTTDR